MAVPAHDAQHLDFHVIADEAELRTKALDSIRRLRDGAPKCILVILGARAPISRPP